MSHDLIDKDTMKKWNIKHRCIKHQRSCKEQEITQRYDVHEKEDRDNLPKRRSGKNHSRRGLIVLYRSSRISRVGDHNVIGYPFDTYDVFLSSVFFKALSLLL